MNWFFLILVVVMPFSGAIFAFRTWHLLRYGVRVPGTITGYARVGTPDGPRSFHIPTVEFCDDEGKIHKLAMKMSETPHESGKPEPVRVIYPKGQPQAARLERFASLWLIPLFLCGPAVVIRAACVQITRAIAQISPIKIGW